MNWICYVTRTCKDSCHKPEIRNCPKKKLAIRDLQRQLQVSSRDSITVTASVKADNDRFQEWSRMQRLLLIDHWGEARRKDNGVALRRELFPPPASLSFFTLIQRQKNVVAMQIRWESEPGLDGSGSVCCCSTNLRQIPGTCCVLITDNTRRY